MCGQRGGNTPEGMRGEGGSNQALFTRPHIVLLQQQKQQKQQHKRTKMNVKPR